jgi:Right handed beta helix region
MALTQIPVVYGSGGLAGPDGLPGTGTITLQPLQETPSADTTIIARRVTYPISGGRIAGIYETNGQAMQALVYENVNGVKPAPPYVVAIPTSGTLDLAVAARSTSGPTPLFVLNSAVGHPGGPGGPLRDDGTMPPDQIPGSATLHPWDIAKQFAGLSNPDILVNHPDNDPNQPIELDADTTYENFHFVCSSLLVNGNNTTVRNCTITCGNSSFGIRCDSNTGLETQRLFEHCVITALGAAVGGGSGCTFRLCEIVGGGDDAFRLSRTYTQGLTVELCYVHDFRPAPGAHADGVQFQVWPAADVTIQDSWIEMTTAAGYSLPGDAGYTGAIFYDVTDNDLPVDDPEPLRRGQTRVHRCRLVSSQNYSVVIDGPGIDISDCMLLPGTTAILSLPTGAYVTGHGNMDASSDPLVDIAIAGQLAEPGTLARLQDVDILTVPPTNGQVPVYNSTSKKWAPGSASGGTSMTIVSSFITSGVTSSENTAGVWAAVEGTAQPLTAAVGEQVAAEYSFTVDNDPATFYDVGVVKAGVVVRLLNTPLAPADATTYEGMAEFVPDNPARFIGSHAIPWFTAAGSDVDTGVITFALCRRSNGTGSADANDDLPMRFTLYNNH